MNWDIVVGTAAIIVGIIGYLLGVSHRVGKIEQKVSAIDKIADKADRAELIELGKTSNGKLEKLSIKIDDNHEDTIKKYEDITAVLKDQGENIVKVVTTLDIMREKKTQ